MERNTSGSSSTVNTTGFTIFPPSGFVSIVSHTLRQTRANQSTQWYYGLLSGYGVMDHILSIVLFTPLAGLLVLLSIPSSNARAIKLWANLAAFIGFLVSLPLVFRFDPGKDYQFVEKAEWIPSLGAS